MKISEITTRDIQAYVTALQQRGFAPFTIDQHHQVLSNILRSAVKWYGLPLNPALGTEMPPMEPKREKWAFSVAQASQLLNKLPIKPRGAARVNLGVYWHVRANRQSNAIAPGRILESPQFDDATGRHVTG